MFHRTAILEAGVKIHNHRSSLYGKTVFITGGTGTLGKALTRYLLDKSDVGKVIVYSRDEFKQFEMRKEFNDERIRYQIGDVRDLERLRRAMRKSDIVVHAAAMKQVPACESNPDEAVKTNIVGSMNVIEATVGSGVEKCIFISSDKAVEPINLYGTTKAAAEKLFIHANIINPIFSCTRWGNIQGSRGSIIPLFKELAMQGKTIPITDPNMSRYLVTFEQAIKTLIVAIGAPAGLVLATKSPSFDIMNLLEAIDRVGEITGSRPSEKLHESLIGQYEYQRAYDMGEYISLEPETHDWDSTAIYPRGRKLIGPWASNNNDTRLSVEQLRERINA